MILVVGATGRLGGLVAHRLLREGWPVRILVRAASPAPALASQGLATDPDTLVAAGAQPFPGSLTAPTALIRACQGVDTVIATANSASRPDETVEQVDLWGNRRLIDAAVAAGVRRFLFVSAQFADVDSPSPFLRAKAAAEAYLRASGLDYTILAPNAFMDTWIARLVLLPVHQGKPATVVGTGRRKHAFIAMEDVVAFVLAALEHPAARNRRLVLGGPDPFSFLDAVDTLEQVLGRAISVRHTMLDGPIPDLPKAMWPFVACFDLWDSSVEMDEIAHTFSVPLTSLEMFIRQHLAWWG